MRSFFVSAGSALVRKMFSCCSQGYIVFVLAGNANYAY